MNYYSFELVTTLRYLVSGEAPLDVAARVVSGDEAAFVAIYRAHFEEVRAFAERVLGSRVAADDVVHDVFLALPGALRSFRGECSLKNFILSIAVRCARSHHRSLLRRWKREERAGVEVTPWTAPSPDAELERTELARLLARALDTLPLDQRVAFILCEVEERTSTEAAEILGENPATVRGRVFHAKKKMRLVLAELAASSAPKHEGGAG